MSTMKAPHALDRVMSVARQPWAITPEMLLTIAAVLEHRVLTGHGDPAALLALAPPVPNQGVAAPTGSGIALIPLHGVIAPRMTALTDISGGTTFEAASQALDEALADDSIGTIVLDVDSPGGSVLGARAFAHKVLLARTRKPTIAQANFEMNSAAYWACAGATEIVAAPGALVGSIGVLGVHDDMSGKLAQQGIKRTLLAAGEHKLDGHPAAPLNDDAAGRMTALLNDYYAQFLADVGHGRGQSADHVREHYGKGRPVIAETALERGMVDRIATLTQTLARFGASLTSAPEPAPSRAVTPSGAPARSQDYAADRELERQMLELEMQQ